MDQAKQNHLAPVTSDLYQETGKTPEWVAGANGHLFGNSRLRVHLLHVAHINPDGKVLYDQIMRGEVAGGYLLPVDEQGRIGLQKMWRMQTCDPTGFSRNYPNIDWKKVGRVSWEAPRGFTSKGETALSSATREAKEETGREVLEVVGSFEHCDNTTFNLHIGTTAIARLHPNQTGELDPTEAILKKVQFFTLAEVRDLQRQGLLYDGPTRAMIGDALLNFPHLFSSQLQAV